MERDDKALAVARYENLTLIAADSIEELRKIDVYRVLESAMSCPGMDVVGYGRWIKERRSKPEDLALRTEVDLSLGELGFGCATALDNA